MMNWEEATGLCGEKFYLRFLKILNMTKGY